MLVQSFMIKHLCYKSALMRAKDEDITSHNSSCRASTKELRKESERDSVRDKM